MTKLELTVAEFREKMRQQDSTFLLIYTANDQVSNTIDTRITSNSSRMGVRTILTFIIRPTRTALGVLASAIEAAARSALGILPEALDAAKEDGAFKIAAENVFEKMLPNLTIVGWEEDDEQRPS